MAMPAWYWERERLRKRLSQVEAYHAPCNWPRDDSDRKYTMFCRHFKCLADVRAQLAVIKPEGADDVPRMVQGEAPA